MKKKILFILVLVTLIMAMNLIGPVTPKVKAVDTLCVLNCHIMGLDVHYSIRDEVVLGCVAEHCL
jgi:hypothetical protein